MKKLRQYQIDMVKYARRTQHPVFFVEMRLGKTLATIRSIKTYAPEHRQKVLVVAPFSAWNGWNDDLTEEGVEHVLMYGSSKDRLKILGEEHTVYITNYESWKGIGKALKSIQWDVVVLDESDGIKNPRAKVSQFYTKNFRNVRHRYILTGTPDPESDMDFFQQIYFSDPSVFNNINFWQFRSSWCYPAGFDYKLKPRNQDKFQKLLASHCYFLKRKDVNLGNVEIVEKKVVQFDPKTKKMYETMLDSFILESTEDNIYKPTMHAGAIYAWMRQLSSGIADGKLVWDGKVKELVRLLTTELKTEPVVVWASYIKEIDYILDSLKQHHIHCNILRGDVAVHDRLKITDDFSKGKFRVLVANPEVCKYGSDFSVASTQVFFSVPASGKTYMQCKERTNKVGKTDSTLIVYLVTENSADELVYEAVISKEWRTDYNQFVMHKLYSILNDNR